MAVAINFLQWGDNYSHDPSFKCVTSPRLSFPENDIGSYSAETGEIELCFMGLTGVDSPLPFYVSQYRELLHPLNHYFYVLFYRVLKKKYEFAPYLDYFNACKKSSRQNVLKLFQDSFKSIAVEMFEYVPRWVTVDTPQAILGSMVLGQRVLVSTVRVNIPRCGDHVVIGQWTMR